MEQNPSQNLGPAWKFFRLSFEQYDQLPIKVTQTVKWRYLEPWGGESCQFVKRRGLAPGTFSIVLPTRGPCHSSTVSGTHVLHLFGRGFTSRGIDEGPPEWP